MVSSSRASIKITRLWDLPLLYRLFIFVKSSSLSGWWAKVGCFFIFSSEICACHHLGSTTLTIPCRYQAGQEHLKGEKTQKQSIFSTVSHKKSRYSCDLWFIIWADLMDIVQNLVYFSFIFLNNIILIF